MKGNRDSKVLTHVQLAIKEERSQLVPSQALASFPCLFGDGSYLGIVMSGRTLLPTPSPDLDNGHVLRSQEEGSPDPQPHSWNAGRLHWNLTALRTASSPRHTTLKGVAPRTLV